MICTRGIMFGGGIGMRWCLWVWAGGWVLFVYGCGDHRGVPSLGGWGWAAGLGLGLLRVGLFLGGFGLGSGLGLGLLTVGLFVGGFRLVFRVRVGVTPGRIPPGGFVVGFRDGVRKNTSLNSRHHVPSPASDIAGKEK